MAVEFIGKPIEVELGEEAGAAPVSFRLGRKEYQVADVLRRWEDQGFGQEIRGHLDRRSQHQRVYYRLRTSEGEVFEIYADWLASGRQGKRRGEKTKWFAYRRIS